MDGQVRAVVCCADPYQAITKKHIRCTYTLITRDYILGQTKTYTLLMHSATCPRMWDIVFNRVESVLTKDELKNYVNIVDNDSTVLFKVSGDAYGTTRLRNLIKMNADVMFTTKYGITPLIRATWASNLESVHIILSTIHNHPAAKQYINQRAHSNNRNALELAQLKQYTAIADLLKKYIDQSNCGQ